MFQAFINEFLQKKSGTSDLKRNWHSEGKKTKVVARQVFVQFLPRDEEIKRYAIYASKYSTAKIEDLEEAIEKFL